MFYESFKNCNDPTCSFAILILIVYMWTNFWLADGCARPNPWTRSWIVATQAPSRVSESSDFYNARRMDITEVSTRWRPCDWCNLRHILPRTCTSWPGPHTASSASHRSIHLSVSSCGGTKLYQFNIFYSFWFIVLLNVLCTCINKQKRSAIYKFIHCIMELFA